MTNTDMTIEQLLEMIDQYFDCTLSDEQEKALRREIAMTPFRHPAIDEARAVMGIRQINAVHRGNKRSITRKIIPGLSIAASVAMIITLGVLFLRPATTDTSTCVAYVNGQKVTDEDIVLALMAQNTTEFHEGADRAQQSIIDELEFIAPVVDQYESNTNPLEI